MNCKKPWCEVRLWSFRFFRMTLRDISYSDGLIRSRFWCASILNSGCMKEGISKLKKNKDFSIIRKMSPKWALFSKISQILIYNKTHILNVNLQINLMMLYTIVVNWGIFLECGVTVMRNTIFHSERTFLPFFWKRAERIPGNMKINRLSIA